MNAAATVGVEPKRADIEGLRAVAILLVVLAHAGVPRLAGGFVGVDVFFVISGYLITGILVRAAQAPRSALVDFYARRLRRLLPALLVVQLVSIALAMLLLAPQEQLTQIAGARAAVLWVSNFQFALSEIDYFGESAENALFLHTWSLSVEEQFYLVWPLLIFLAMGVWRRGGSAIGQHRARYALALLAACGLIVPLLQTPIAPLQAYYLLPARFWQFALGGLLMLWQMRASARLTLTVAGARWAVAAGLGLVGASAFMLDGTQPYPGAWAIAPTLGTAAVLAAGFGRPSGVTAMLAAAPMQWVGRHSYGWYLWHWPLLLLGRALAPAGMALGTALGLMALALALAVASQRWIEAPIRYSAHLARRPGLTIALAMSGMAFGLLAAQAWESVAGNWAQRPQQAKYFQNDPKHYELYPRGSDVAIRSSEMRP